MPAAKDRQSICSDTLVTLLKQSEEVIEDVFVYL